MAEMNSSVAVRSAMDAPMSSSLVVTSAMDAPMSSSLGAMGPLLRKLDSLLPPGYRLPKLLKDRIGLLKADLEEISVALVEQSMVDSPNEMARYWMNEVRELCYDIEDFIDNMMSAHADAKMRSVQSYKVGRVKIAWLPKTRKPCTRAAKIAEFRTLVREASERHVRYLVGCISSSRCVFIGHSRIRALYAEAANNLVGVEDSKMKLIKWLTNKEEQQLKVVAIVGPAGVGKTALAKQVYREAGEQFECRAFVRASRKPDMRRLLGGILSQVQRHQCPSSFCTVQNLIDNLTKHLQDKRYLIIIDDLWEATSWDIVTSAFPKGNNYSRIITTTEVEGVALECCDYQSRNMLKMEPLGAEDSGKLLVNLVFGPEHLCPDQLRDTSDIIITKCAGLPLATTFVAGLLKTQPNNAELWQHVHECLCSSLSTNSTLEETLQEILKLSYNSLPHYLKTCLMYLSVHPEGYTLWKDDLAKQWIAEGFVGAIEGTDIGEVAESYFEQLVDRGMIQPIDINYNGEVLSCTLHHVVLDLLTLESTEEEFVTPLDYSQIIRGNYSKARRLSLHFSNARYAAKPTGLSLSKIRSIAFFGILECVPSLVEFKCLRVLILEFWGDQRGSTSFNLTRICRLFQLRYLKILCDASVEVELPTQMRMLRYLETLIIDAAGSAIPLDIVNLPRLLHLSLGDKADLPDEIGRLRSLRTLHCFDLGSNSEDNILSLGDLKNLQDLHLTYCTEGSNEHLKRNLAALASSLGKLENLKSVTLSPAASGTAIYHDVWSSMSSLPIFLQRLEFLPPICIFSRLPKCIEQLRKLHTLKVVVSELLMEDMDILIGLPSLTILSLHVRRPTAESIIFRRGAFLGLKYFKYTCGVLSLAFQEEAFPNLQRLDLSFNAHRGEQYDHLLLGIDYLVNVKEIAGKIGAAAGAEEPDRRVAESAFKDAIRKHPRFPSYDNVKRVDWVCEEYQLPTQEKDLSSENYAILQKELRRKEGDSSDDQSRILPKEIEEDTKLYAHPPVRSLISHFPATGSVITFDQMKTARTSEGKQTWGASTMEDRGGGRRVGDYMLLRPIGSGAYSQVWLGKHLARGTEVAVKEIAMERLSTKLRDSLLSEVDILRRIRHPNIIALHDSIRDGGRIYLILEYCRGGDLYSYLLRHKRVPETVAKHFIRQLACGLQMLRDNNMVHRDLKPQNVLLVANSGNSVLKIADFGFAKFLEPLGLAETLCGSPLYMAPEVMQGQKYDAKADLWSVGIILYQLVTGSPPFNGDSQIQLMRNILKSGQLRFPPGCELSHDCIDLCTKLLRIDSVERLTVEEFVNHPFLFEHPPERTLSRTPSDTRDGFPFPKSSPPRLSSQSSQDCMPFPLDLSTGQDESPVPESNSPLKSHGFNINKKSDKTSGQSPSKHAGLFSRYIMGNNHAPSSQRLDHTGKRTKESKIEGNDPKGGYREDSSIIDSLEFVDQECVFVSGHPEGSSSSTSASQQRNLPLKYDNPSVSPPKLAAPSAPMPIRGTTINRQQSAGTGSLDSHCSPVSGTSQGSAYLSDGLDQPPSDYLTRIRLLGQYASTIVELVKEEIKGGRHLEAFSIQLIVLATWKQAIHICKSYAASAARECPSDDINMPANSQLADDECMQIERQFLIDVEYAEELASTIGQIPDATAMPDAVEIIFQSALELGRHGGVDEMMGKAPTAISRYTKAICMLRFLLIEAPSLALNPPLSLTRSDRHRLCSYIEALNTRLSQLQYQRH